MQQLTDFSISIPGKNNTLHVDTINRQVSLINNSEYRKHKFYHLTEKDIFTLHEIQNNSTEVLKLWLFTTMKCDFNCVYCIQNGGIYNPTDMMSKEVVHQAFSYLTKYITSETKRVDIIYFGGEPLTNFDIVAYAMDYFNTNTKVSLSHSIFTNGYNLSLEKIRKLSELGIGSIQITLDGNAEIHDKRRITKLGEGTFNKIKNNIIYLLNETIGTQITIKSVIDKNNAPFITKFINDELELLKNKRISLDISIMKHINGNTNNPSIMSRKEFSEFYKSIIPYIFKNGINATPPFLAGCSLNSENIIIVSPDGSLYRCPSMVDNKPFSIGNVFSKELSLNKVVSSTLLNSNCKKCKFAFLCNGGCKYNNIVYHNTYAVNTDCYYSEIENDLYNYYAAKYSQYLI